MTPIIYPTYKGESRLPRVRECLNAQRVAIEIWERDNNVNGVMYTRAINEGLMRYAFSGNEFVLAMCDDVYLKPNCLLALLACAKANPSAGIIAPVQRSAQGQIQWAGSAQSWPAGAHFGQVLKPTAYETHWACGACMLLRTAMIKEIGLMDKNMLFVCSDSDYSLRARAAGWKVLVEPAAEVEHTFAGSANKTDPELAKIKINDHKYFTNKWLSGELFRSLEYPGQKNDFAVVVSELFAMQRMLDKVG